ncbi:MAG: hypothetical protein ACE5JX_12575 [Acidobacteriota bacterium]
MSRELGARMPDEVVREMRKPSPRLTAVPLLTVDRKGFPHVALLSYFEILWKAEAVHFFLHSSSRSTRFLRNHGLCTLVFINRDFAYYVKGRARWKGDLDSQSLFQFRVEAVLEDYPSTQEGEAFLKSGIRFETGKRESDQRLQLRQRMSLLIERRS